MRPLFSFDPPPTFDPADDPAALELERLESERRAEQERALEVLGIGAASVIESCPTDAHLDALAVLAPSTRGSRPTHLVIDLRVDDAHLDALQIAVGGKWNGNTLESPAGRWLAVLVGIEGEASPRAVVIDWSAP